MIDHRLFITRLYDESLTLVVEARNYFEYSEAAYFSSFEDTPRNRLFVNYQAMRLTSRMTQAMAWLMAQRALHAGELLPEEACGGIYSLGGESICTELDGYDDDRIPTGMRQLLKRSHALYHRIWRLDQAARDKFAR